MALITFPPTGLVALLHATQVHGLWRRGDAARAVSASRRAHRWAVVSWIIGGILVLVVAALIALVVVVGNGLAANTDETGDQAPETPRHVVVSHMVHTHERDHHR